MSTGATAAKWLTAAVKRIMIAQSDIQSKWSAFHVTSTSKPTKKTLAKMDLELGRFLSCQNENIDSVLERLYAWFEHASLITPENCTTGILVAKMVEEFKALCAGENPVLHRYLTPEPLTNRLQQLMSLQAAYHDATQTALVMHSRRLETTAALVAWQEISVEFLRAMKYVFMQTLRFQDSKTDRLRASRFLYEHCQSQQSESESESEIGSETGSETGLETGLERNSNSCFHLGRGAAIPVLISVLV